MKLYNDLKQVWNQKSAKCCLGLLKEKEDETKKNPNKNN